MVRLKERNHAIKGKARDQKVPVHPVLLEPGFLNRYDGDPEIVQLFDDPTDGPHALPREPVQGPDNECLKAVGPGVFVDLAQRLVVITPVGAGADVVNLDHVELADQGGVF